MANEDFKVRLRGALLLHGYKLKTAANAMRITPCTLCNKMKDPINWRHPDMEKIADLIGYEEMFSIFFPNAVAQMLQEKGTKKR